MKKKLLLSSVAALTLFAAYNTASAEGTYGLSGKAEENLLDAFKIKNPTTVAEVNETVESVAERQQAANTVRERNHELTQAKEAEANAEAEFKKAQEDYFTASKNYKLAKDNAVAASEKAAELTKTLNSITTKKTDAEKELGKKAEGNNAATGAYLKLEQAKTALEQAKTELETAKSDVEAHYRTRPVSSSDVEAHKKYQTEKIAKEALLDKAKETKKTAEETVSKLEKEISKLEETIKKANKEITILTEAIAALNKVAGDKVNTGEVDGVTLKQLDDLAKEKADAIGQKQEAYVNSSVNRADAQKAFDAAVEAAKEVYKRLKVEFDLDDVLAVDTPTPDAVTKFGWNKNDKGEWTYVVDSKGNTAKGWVNDGGSWYYLNKEGVMQKWWVQVDGTWYFLNGSGVMETGWLQDNGTWYYLEDSGAMKANQWFEVGGKWYHVNESGALSVNTTVGEYNVNENGEWV